MENGPIRNLELGIPSLARHGQSRPILNGLFDGVPVETCFPDLLTRKLTDLKVHVCCCFSHFMITNRQTADSFMYGYCYLSPPSTTHSIHLPSNTTLHPSNPSHPLFVFYLARSVRAYSMAHIRIPPAVGAGY